MKVIFLLLISALMFKPMMLPAEVIEMDCQHSFQGNYSGGYVSFRYRSLLDSEDEAYVKAKAGWVRICTDIQNADQIVVKDSVASCMIYMANWMNGKKKHYIWDFEEKVLYVQTLTQRLNPKSEKRDWQWVYSVNEVGSKDWKVLQGWESEGVKYEKRKCK